MILRAPTRLRPDRLPPAAGLQDWPPVVECRCGAHVCLTGAHHDHCPVPARWDSLDAVIARAAERVGGGDRG